MTISAKRLNRLLKACADELPCTVCPAKPKGETACEVVDGTEEQCARYLDEWLRGRKEPDGT